MNHTQLFFHKHNKKELTLEGEVACNHYKKLMVKLIYLNYKFYFYNLFYIYPTIIKENMYFVNFTIFFYMNPNDDFKPCKM